MDVALGLMTETLAFQAHLRINTPKVAYFATLEITISCCVEGTSGDWTRTSDLGFMNPLRGPPNPLQINDFRTGAIKNTVSQQEWTVNRQ